MAREKAYRKYQITINNPAEHGFTHEQIKSIILANFKHCEYWCMCDEVGAEGTCHTHVYLCFTNAISWSTIHKIFYGCHIENARGSNQENRDYIRKEGKWLDDVKSETNLIDTFEEMCPLPDEPEKKSQSEAVVAMVKSGSSNLEIVDAFPSQINHLKNINAYREELITKEFENIYRELEVYYLWGKTGVGKTRSVLDTYGYKNVYRVTNYAHPFDGYNGEPVIVFDEFRSDLPIKDMLKYLEGYPLKLPCRYNDKTACYTKVYVISNIPFEKQYPNIQVSEPETWKAFRRRFNVISEFIGNDIDDKREVRDV